MYQVARAVDGWVPRRAIAAAANAVISRRHGSGRRFAVDGQGLWINEQPEATFVSPDIYTATYEQVEQRVLSEWCDTVVLRPGDIVLDVGAGIGEESIVFSKLVGPKGRVIAIEAHPRTFDALVQTIRRSELTNVTPVHCAITDMDGEVFISDSNNHLANSLLSGGDTRRRVQARSFDSLVDELGLSSIALLKMNIEGAERQAVRGISRSANLIRHLVIECHDFVANRGGSDAYRTRDDVSATLAGLGFRTERRRDAETAWLADRITGSRA